MGHRLCLKLANYSHVQVIFFILYSCYNNHPKLIKYRILIYNIRRVKKIEVTVYCPIFNQPESFD